MKKKILSTLLVVTLLLSLSACGKDSESKKTSNKDTVVENTETEESNISASNNIPVLSLLDSTEVPDSIDVSLKEFVPDSPPEEELDKFNTAYELWYNDNAGEALASFMAFPVLYPNSCLNDDAQKYVGVCYDSLSMSDRALEAFSKVITDFPDSPLIASAYYNIAHIYYYNNPELSYPYYVACLKNATTDDEQIVEHSIETLSEETNIKISYNPLSSEIDNNIEDVESTSEEKTSEEPMVWIPSSGSKYHSSSSCSNMESPTQVTESKAISMGYAPCKRCH